jgi:sarcosine oxidase subunit gamma
VPEAIRLESPLARWRLEAAVPPPLDAPGIVAWERAFLGHLVIRGDGADGRFAAAVADVLGMALPAVPNTVAAGRQGVACWLGPDEWLLVTPGAREAAIATALREALRGVFASVVAVGSGQTAIVLRGAPVRDLLAKECPLDLHAPAFRLGACAQTRLGKIPLLLRPLEGDAIEVIVRRSYAGYFWTWLVDAAAEYGFLAGPQPAAAPRTPAA